MTSWQEKTICGAAMNRRSAIGLGAAGVFAAFNPGAFAQAKDPIKLRILAAPTSFEALYIGKEQGIFAKHGLEVEIVPGGTADSMIPQLLNGQAQFGLSSALAVIMGVSRGLPVKLAVGNVTSGTKPVTAALIVPKDSPIKGLADLKGKKVAFAGLRSQPHLGVIAALKEMGVDPASVSFLELPPPTLQSAVLKGTVDAIYPFEPFLSTALASGFRPVDLTLLSRYLDGVPAVAFAASNDFLRNNKPAVKAFIAAISEAQALANARPELVRDVDLRYTKLPPEFIKARVIAPLTPTIDTQALERFVIRVKDGGWISQAPALADLVDEQAPRK